LPTSAYVESVTFNAELFDRLSANYDEQPPFFKAIGAELVTFAELPPGAVVLDVGAGKGGVTIPTLAAVGSTGRVTAIDVAPGMVEHLQRLGAPNLTVELQDVTRLVLPAASHDHAVSGFTLHILEDLSAALIAIHRVLRAGGTLSWSMPGPHPEAATWAEAYGRIYEDFSSRLDEVPSGMRDVPDREQQIRDAGFDICDEIIAPVCIPVGGAEQYWAWTQSHGARWLSDALEERDAADLKRAVIDSLLELHPTRGNDIMVAPRFTKLARLARGR
jgi:ubiquinone/menaquinone biosynthesis C-methylase UbiE